MLCSWAMQGSGCLSCEAGFRRGSRQGSIHCIPDPSVGMMPGFLNTGRHTQISKAGFRRSPYQGSIHCIPDLSVGMWPGIFLNTGRHVQISLLHKSPHIPCGMHRLSLHTDQGKMYHHIQPFPLCRAT